MAELRASSESAARQWNDEKIENSIGRLLQAGVLLSAAVVFAGGVLYLLMNGGNAAHYETFSGDRAQIRSLRDVLRGVSHLDGRALIQLGLILLVATPVARVLFSIVAFWRERDRLYVCITLVVLILLLYSLMTGIL